MGRLLSVEDVAKILKKAPQTIRNLIYAKKNPIPHRIEVKPIKAGKKMYFHRKIRVLEDELKIWIDHKLKS